MSSSEGKPRMFSQIYRFIIPAKKLVRSMPSDCFCEKKLIWAARIKMKWRYDHRAVVIAIANFSPENIFRASNPCRNSNPWLLRWPSSVLPTELWRPIRWEQTNRPFPSSLVPLIQSDCKSANHSYENDFDLHENEIACRTHFHMKGFALRLVLKSRHKRTWKWPIYRVHLYSWQEWDVKRT